MAKATTDGRLVYVDDYGSKLRELLLQMPYARVRNNVMTFQFTPIACWDLVRNKAESVTIDVGIAAAVDSVHGAMESKVSRTGQQSYPMLKTKPWKHQAAGIDFVNSSVGAYLAMAPGTGKSLTTIGAMGDHKRILILTPKSVVRVWPREFNRHANYECNVVPIVSGNTDKKVQQARQALSVGRQTAIVINYEAARCKAFADWASSQLWDAVVCDEAHRTKAPSGVTAKFVHKLGRMAGQRLNLSGTPIPHDILDAWSQFMFLDPGVFGTNFMRFKRKYSEIGFFNEVKSFKNLDEFAERFRLLSYEVSHDVLDLPPITHQSRVFELSPATMRSYVQLKDELAAYIESGVVTAANSLVTTIRLQQITSGFYKDDNTDQIVDLNDSAKADALVDIIDDLPRGEPIVVFAKFRRDLDRIKAIAEQFGLRYGELSGSRNDLTSEAMMPHDVDIMGVNIQSGGVGIDLTRAAYAVYYSLSWSSGEFEQSLRRLHRPGQKRHVTCYHLVAANTVDEKIYAAIEERRAIEEAIVYGITERKTIIRAERRAHS
jgi:SNF2 family DNA or RNA helicase